MMASLTGGALRKLICKVCTVTKYKNCSSFVAAGFLRPQAAEVSVSDLSWGLPLGSGHDLESGVPGPQSSQAPCLVRSLRLPLLLPMLPHFLRENLWPKKKKKNCSSFSDVYCCQLICDYKGHYLSFKGSATIWFKWYLEQLENNSKKEWSSKKVTI